MGRCSMLFRGMYVVWSTIIDDAIFVSETREEFAVWYRAEYGRQGEFDLQQSLDLIDDHGTSWPSSYTTERVMEYNRSGPDESRLTLDELEALFRDFLNTEAD